MDGYGNFGLLRERLGKDSDKTALMQLEMVRISALDEFRELTKLGKTITLFGQTYDDVKRHNMSVEEKERLVIVLGGVCFEDGIESTVRDGCLEQDITLRRLDAMPNCAMLYALAMIENVTDGNGSPHGIPIRFNFLLTDDVNNIFQGLITKISMFYPEVPIGKIESIAPAGDKKVVEAEKVIFESAHDNKDKPAAIDPSLRAFEATYYLTSQLLARYHFLSDNNSLAEFYRRMDICGVSREKAEILKEHELDIIIKNDKRNFAERYSRTRIFPLTEKAFTEDIDYYIKNRLFTMSELISIVDEAGWHYNKSPKDTMPEDVWNEIDAYSAGTVVEKIQGYIEDSLKDNGWTDDEFKRYLSNEIRVLAVEKWLYVGRRHPYAPGASRPLKRITTNSVTKAPVAPKINTPEPPAPKVKKPGRGWLFAFLFAGLPLVGMTIYGGILRIIWSNQRDDFVMDYQYFIITAVSIGIAAFFLLMYLRKKTRREAGRDIEDTGTGS
jgi:hypothetical protein